MPPVLFLSVKLIPTILLSVQEKKRAEILHKCKQHFLKMWRLAWKCILSGNCVKICLWLSLFEFVLHRPYQTWCYISILKCFWTLLCFSNHSRWVYSPGFSKFISALGILVFIASGSSIIQHTKFDSLQSTDHIYRWYMFAFKHSLSVFL